MLMLVLFPLVFIVALAIWIASALRARSVTSVPGAQTAAVLALAASYGLGLALVSLYPYFDDNGVREFIAWPHRWAWAAEYAGWLALLVVPTGLGVYAMVRRLGGKVRADGGSSSAAAPSPPPPLPRGERGAKVAISPSSPSPLVGEGGREAVG